MSGLGQELGLGLGLGLGSGIVCLFLAQVATIGAIIYLLWSFRKLRAAISPEDGKDGRTEK